jgi:hypothetical protein
MRRASQSTFRAQTPMVFAGCKARRPSRREGGLSRDTSTFSSTTRTGSPGTYFAAGALVASNLTQQ